MSTPMTSMKRRATCVSLARMILCTVFVGLAISAASNAAPGPATTQAAAPPAPENFFAQSTGPSEIDLYWRFVDDPELRRNIYRGFEPGFSLSADTLIARETDARFYRDRGLLPRTTYYYRVTAVRNGQESLPSHEDSSETFPAKKSATTSPSH